MREVRGNLSDLLHRHSDFDNGVSMEWFRELGERWRCLSPVHGACRAAV